MDQINPITNLPQGTKSLSSSNTNKPVSRATLIQEAPTYYQLPDKYENYGFSFVPGLDMNELRAQRQSTGEIIGKGFGKLIGNTVFELAKTVPYAMGVLGAPALAASDDGLKLMFDNAILRGISDAQEYFNEDLMKVYTTHAANGSLWDRLTDGTFWATQGADAASFFLSMMLPGRAVAALGLGTKLMKGGINVAKWSNVLSKEAQLSGKVAKVADNTMSVLVNSALEATAEASHFYTENRDKLIKSGMATEDAERIASMNATGLFKANMGILMLSNFVLEGALFKGFDDLLGLGKPNINAVFDSAGKAIDTPFKAKKLQRALMGIGTGVASEGFYEEGFQYAAEKYYEKRLNNTIDDDSPIRDIITEYTSRIFKDSDMSTGIFLGGLLGGGAGMVGGISAGIQAKNQIMGNQADSKFKAQLKKALGMTPTQASPGLRELFKNNLISKINTADLYQRDEKGEIVMQDNAPVLNMDKVQEAISKTSGAIFDLLNVDHAIQMNDQVAFNNAKSILDFNFMLPYFEVKGGDKVLDEHLKIKAQEYAQKAKEINPDAELTYDEILKGLQEDAKAYKKLYDRINDTHAVNSKMFENTPLAKEFDRLVKENKFSYGLRETIVNKNLKFLKEKLSKLDENTADGKSNIEKFERKIEALEKTKEKLLTQGLEFYNNKKLKTMYENFKASDKTRSEVQLGDTYEDADGNLFELSDFEFDYDFSIKGYKLKNTVTDEEKTVDNVDNLKYLGNLIEAGEENIPEKEVTDDQAKDITDRFVELLNKSPEDAVKLYENEVANKKFKLPKDLRKIMMDNIKEKFNNLDKITDIRDLSQKLIKNSTNPAFKKSIQKISNESIKGLKNIREVQISTLSKLILNLQTQIDDLATTSKNLSKEINSLNKELNIIYAELNVDLAQGKTAEEANAKYEAAKKQIEKKIEDLKDARVRVVDAIEGLKDLITNAEEFKKWISTKDTYTEMSEYLSKMANEYNLLLNEQKGLAKKKRLSQAIDNLTSPAFIRSQYEEQVALSDKLKESIEELESQIKDINDSLNALSDKDKVKQEKLRDKLLAEANKLRKQLTSKKLDTINKLYDNSKKLSKFKDDLAVITELMEQLGNLRNTLKKEIAVTTSDLPTPYSYDDDSFRRRYRSLFMGLGGSHFPKDVITDIPSQQRYYKFLQSNKLDDAIVHIVSEKDYPQLFSDLERQRYQEALKQEGVVEDEILFAIFMINGKYVDMFGNPLDTLDPERAIYTTLNTPNNNPETYAKRVAQPKDVGNALHMMNIQQEIDWFKQIKEKILTDINSGKSVLIPVSGKSKGVAVKDTVDGKINNKPFQSIGIDPQQARVFIQTTDSYVQNNLEITGHLGRLFVVDPNTDNVHIAYVDYLSEQHQETIYRLIEQMAQSNDWSKGEFMGKTYYDHISLLTHYGKADSETKSRIYDLRKNGLLYLKLDGKDVELTLDSNKNLIHEKEIRTFLSTLKYNVKNKVLTKTESGNFSLLEYVNGRFRVNDSTYNRRNTIRENYIDFLFNGDNPIVSTYAPLPSTDQTNVQFMNMYAFVDFNYYSQSNDISIPRPEYKDLAPKAKSKRLDNLVDKYIKDMGVLELTYSAGDFWNDQHRVVQVIYETEEGIKSISIDYETGLQYTEDIITAKDEIITGDRTFKTAAEAYAFYLSQKPKSVKYIKLKEGASIPQLELPFSQRTGARVEPAIEVQPEVEVITEEEPVTAETVSDAHNTQEPVAENSTTTLQDDTDSLFPDLLLDDTNEFFKLAQENIRPIDLEKELQWFKDKFPHINIDVVDKLIRGKAWGMFLDNAVTIFEQAGEGTVYHEAFHVVFNLYLDPAEKRKLIKAYKEHHKVDYSDYVIEEMLADDFMDYMLTGKLADFAIKEQRNFFRRLWDFIKDLFGIGSAKTLKGYFDEIKLNKYSTTPKYNFKGSRYRKLEGLSEVQTNDLVDGILYELFNQFRYKSEESQLDFISSLMSIKGINSDYSTRRLLTPGHRQNVLRIIGAKIKDDLKNKTRYNNTDEVNNATFALIVDIIKGRKEKQLFDIVREKLSRLSLELDSTELDELLTEDDNANDQTIYDQLAIEVSGKRTASTMLRKFFATFHQTAIENGKVVLAKNSLGLPYNADFSYLYSLLANKLSNKTNIQSMIDSLTGTTNLSILQKQILNRLGETPNSAEKFLTQIQFFQAFAKQRINYLVSILDENETVTFDASMNYFRDKIKRLWAERANYNRVYIVTEDSKIYNMDVLNPMLDDIKALRSDSRYYEFVYDFLNEIGIQFTGHDKKMFAKNIKLDEELKRRVDNMLQIFLTAQKTSSDLIDIFDAEGNNAPNLAYFVEYESLFSGDAFENQHINFNNKTVYDISLNTYQSLIVNGINDSKTKQELLNKFPHLNDEYLQNSVLFSKLFFENSKADIYLAIHEGLTTPTKNISKEFDSLNRAEKLYMLVRDTLQHRYHMIRPADNALERTLDFGRDFISQPYDNGVTDEVVGTMLGYLIDEIKLNNPDRYSNFTNRLVSAPTIIFDFLSPENQERIKSLKQKYFNGESVDLLKEVNSPSIVLDIKLFLESQIDETVKLFKKYKFVGEKNENIAQLTDSPVYSQTGLMEVAAKFYVNWMISQIEQTKWFTGSPAFYKDVKEFYKRMSALVGTKKLPETSPATNQWISENLVRRDNRHLDLSPTVKVYVVNDIITESNRSDLHPVYNETNEADAVAYLNLDFYRELMFRIGDWTPQMELVYYHEIGLTTIPEWTPFISFVPGTEIDITEFGTNGYVLPPLKPQSYGPLMGSKFVPAMYKLMGVPLTKSLIANSQLQQLESDMVNKGVDVVMVESANKVGRKLTNSGGARLYDDDGKINSIDTELVQDSQMQFWGIQVDNGPKRKIESPEGTQQMVQHKSDLYNQGVPITLDINGEKVLASTIEMEFNRLNSDKINMGVEILKSRIGFDTNTLADIVKSLKRELIKRNTPDNIIDSLSNLSHGLEASHAKEKIENMLFSIAESESISRKRFGSGLVQIPVTGFEEQREIVNGKIQRSNVLKFYEDGGLEVMLPMIFKDKFGKFIDSKIDMASIDPRLLEAIGFRIPTQGLSSIEYIVIKKFLPAHLGDIIILPTEITTKNGSDFDFDKMYALFNSYRIKGNKLIYEEYIEDPNQFDQLFKERKHELVREYNLDKGLIKELLGELKKYKTEKLLNSQELERYQEIALPIKQSQGESFDNLVEAKTELALIVDQLEKTEALRDTLSKEDYDELIDDLIESNFTQQRIDFLNNVISSLESVMESNGANIQETIQLLDKTIETKLKQANVSLTMIKDVQRDIDSGLKTFFDNLSVAAKNGPARIDNRLNEIERQIISSKTNDEALKTPLVDSEAKAAGKYLEYLLSKDYSISFEDWIKQKKRPPFHQLIKIGEYEKVQEEFLNATRAIGISALNQISHIQFQRHGIEIILGQPVADGVTTQMNLPHNKSASGNVALGMRTNVEGVLISQLLSQMTSAYVDAVKDPFAFYLNAGTQTAPMFLYLLRAGVPMKTVALFMNQPIIRDYLEQRNIYESIYWDRYTKSDRDLYMSRDQIIASVKAKYNPKSVPKDNTEFTNEAFEEAIKANELTDQQLADQQAYLTEFLSHLETSKRLSDIINSLTYNTKGFGKNSSQLMMSLQNTGIVFSENASIFKNLEFILSDDTSFLFPYYMAAQDMLDIFKPLSIIMRSEDAKSDINYIISYMSEASKSKDQITKVIDRYRSEMITYLLHQHPEINEGVEARLFYGENSVPKRLIKVRYQLQNSGIPNKLLDYIEANIASQVNQPDMIIPKSDSRVDMETSNEITEGWRELLISHPDFAEDLVKYVIIQSGMTYNPINFIQFIPYEKFFDYVKPGLENFDIKDFFNLFLHDASMANDNDIVPHSKYNKGAAKVYPISKTTVDERTSKNKLKSRKITLSDKQPVRGMFMMGRSKPVSMKDYFRSSNGSIKSKFSPTIVVAPSRKKGWKSDDEKTKYANAMIAVGIPGTKSITKLKEAQTQGIPLNNSIIVTPATVVYAYIEQESLHELIPQLNRVANGKIISNNEDSMKGLFGEPSGYIEGVPYWSNLKSENTKLISNSDIYSKLKTKSENVVIKSWDKLKNSKQPIINNEIVSTRIQGTNQHFGNPFSSDKKVLVQNSELIETTSTKESVQKYIDWVINSEEERAKWIREQLKSGKLKGLSILYYKELGEPSHANALDYLINEYNWTGSQSKYQSLDIFTNHSGGASGADTMWDQIGKTYGMTKNKHYYAIGEKTPLGNTELTKEELSKADPILKRTNQVLKRTFPSSKPAVDNLLRRNYYQVINSDAVYAISTITNNLVDGGTGWAVHMAILLGKPVYVFDQNVSKWYTYSNNKFVETETPILTPNFAGIGTRKINDNGIQAIKDVYENTLEIPQVDQLPAVTTDVDSKLDELNNCNN